MYYFETMKSQSREELIVSQNPERNLDRVTQKITADIMSSLTLGLVKFYYSVVYLSFIL